MEFVSVSDGADPMKYLYEHPDNKVIMLLDLNMPNMEGKEVSIDAINLGITQLN